jgi:hypothetical protein
MASYPALEIVPVPRILRMPKPNEHRNRKSLPTRVLPAEVIQLPRLNDADEEEASAAKVAKWLTDCR